PFEQLAWKPDNLLGESVWHTQAAVLIADWIMLRALSARGLRPAMVSGHSFGEFAAMIAAGCWDLTTALRATWFRCQAITQHVPAGASMLSIQADRTTTERLIRAHRLPLSISHLNAPSQTVVGGKHAC